MTEKRSLLNHLGLHTPQLRAWAMYDWGISAYQTVIMAAVFPIFFNQYAASDLTNVEKTQWFSFAQTIGAIIIAVLAPILGAVADYKAAKKKFLGWFMLLGVASTAAMSLIGQGQVMFACVLLVVSLAGATGSTAFYEALLPHIATEEEMDRVSTAGYALGYVGGGVLLALNLAIILHPEFIGLPATTTAGLTPEQSSLPTRLSFISVGIWWLLFSIPVLRKVPEPPRTIEADERADANPFGVAFSRLGETLRELRGYKQAFLMMVAFTIYNDGIQTIIKMAAQWGDRNGIERGALISAILMVQFIGIPCAFAFGYLAKFIGAKRGVLLGITVYGGICVYAYFMDSTKEFYVLAIVIGLVQGGTQALSRSMFANMIPRHKSGEFFGFFSVFEKFGGIAGPALFGIVAGLGGESNLAILSVVVFFIVGGIVLLFVDPKEGERAARAADAAIQRV